ncbi:hypothetical protein BC834DRAFT_1011712 [Gloeopeniophorella convolvens]|nr:hypothetical protein BC834DRAFT_1011712 [Gloeopeniophorella convolvens]
MHPFGGTQICPRCSKAVYAAEQAMGPGRKPCLACTSCGVRLDSLRLVEHDEENFGTRDLRQANLPHYTGTPPLSPTRTGASVPSSPQRGITSPPLASLSTATSPPTLSRKGPLFSPSTVGRQNTGVFPDPASSPAPLLRPNRALSPTRPHFTAEPERVDGDNSTIGEEDDDHEFTPSHVGRFEGGLPRTVPLTPDRAVSPTKRPPPSFSPATLGRALSLNGSSGSATRSLPPLAASATGTRYGVGLTGGLRSTPTGSPARQWGSGTPQCPRCGKSVYFAEQVKAIGKTWHKACLRCTECGTTLDSSRLTERDGDPYCHRCYNKLHGPAGSGYALLGKAGG